MIGRHSRLALGAAATVLLALLTVFALELANSQSKARGDVEGRFNDRAKASAAVTGSLFESASATGQAENVRLYGGRTVSPQRLAEQVKQANGVYQLVLSADGRIFAASPGTPAAVRRAVAAKPPYVRQLLAGRAYALSNVQRAGLQAPGLAYGQAFPTRFGRRVAISGMNLQLISAFLAGSLKQVPTVKGELGYVLDARGAIVAGPGQGTKPGSPVGEPGLLKAIGKDEQGSFGDDKYFVSRPVKGTPWRIVLTAGNEELFASVSGSRKWIPWILFAGFGLAAGVALLLLRRVLRTAAELSSANADLGVANRVLKRRAGELSRSNEQLERFASIASHDLQEPLRKVQTFAARLERHEGDRVSPTGRDYLQRMTDAARRMQHLIDDLLAFSRITTQESRQEEVRLTDVAREVVGDLDAVIQESDATVEVGGLPTLSADPLRMHQLLQNLVSNAIKYRRDDVPPVIRIDGRVHDGLAEITVSDNGIGFDQRHSERIFRVFERLHGREAYPGTGIGLALCRRIAERHGGTITADGTLGEGSTFTVTLPLQGTNGNSAVVPYDTEEEPLARA